MRDALRHPASVVTLWFVPGLGIACHLWEGDAEMREASYKRNNALGYTLLGTHLSPMGG